MLERNNLKSKKIKESKNPKIKSRTKERFIKTKNSGNNSRKN